MASLLSDYAAVQDAASAEGRPLPYDPFIPFGKLHLITTRTIFAGGWDQAEPVKLCTVPSGIRVASGLQNLLAKTGFLPPAGIVYLGDPSVILQQVGGFPASNFPDKADMITTEPTVVYYQPDNPATVPVDLEIEYTSTWVEAAEPVYKEANDLDICNRALQLISDDCLPADTNLDAGTPADNIKVKYCRQWLHVAKNEVLAHMDWGFAGDDVALTAAAAPGLNWTHAHFLPGDANRLTKVWGSEDGVTNWVEIKSFQLGRSKIRTNAPFLMASYIGNIPFSEWPPAAQAAVVRLLAHYLAVPVTGKDDVAAKMLNIYEQRDRPKAEYEDATQFASNENFDPNDQINNSHLSQVRGYGLTSYSNDL